MAQPDHGSQNVFINRTVLYSYWNVFQLEQNKMAISSSTTLSIANFYNLISLRQSKGGFKNWKFIFDGSESSKL